MFGTPYNAAAPTGVGAPVGFGASTAATYGASTGQKLPNVFDGQGNSLSEYYVTRLAPAVFQQGIGGFNAGMQGGTFGTGSSFGTAFGQPGGTGFNQPGFGQPALNQPGFNQNGLNQPTFTQNTFNQGGFNQPAFGQQSTTFGQQTFQQGGGITSTAQLDALTQSLDASKLMRTGKLLESIRADLGVPAQQKLAQSGQLGQYGQNNQAGAAPQQATDAAPTLQTKQLLDSLHSALAQQTQGEQPAKFSALTDYSQVQRVQNSAFQADFSTTQPRQQFSQIGAYQLDISEPAVSFANPHAPVSKLYVTMPSLQQMAVYTDQMLERVQNFTVHAYKGGKLIGSLRFLYPVNLIGVDLDSVINIDFKCCNLRFTQHTAYQLNAPAEVTLYDVFCPSGVAPAEYHTTIQNITQQNNGKLIEWNPEQGVWRFSVNSFIG